MLLLRAGVGATDTSGRDEKGVALGPRLVGAYMDEVAAYYALQAGADNHAVREAACHCIAEAAAKVFTAAGFKCYAGSRAD